LGNSRFWGWREIFFQNFCGRAVSRMVPNFGGLVELMDLVNTAELFGPGALP